jgi:5S rRNA maturation endonuclease (ribonuclease M5)
MASKETLYEELKKSKHANFSRQELNKPPKKIKVKHLIEEAAQTIAKTKQEIRDIRT